MKLGILTPSFRQAIGKLAKSPETVESKDSYSFHSKFLLGEFSQDVSRLVSRDNSKTDLDRKLNSTSQEFEPTHIPETNKTFEREKKEQLTTGKFKGEEALVLTSYELSVRDENDRMGAYRDPEGFESTVLQQAKIRRADALDIYTLFEYPSLGDDQVMVEHKYQNFSEPSKSVTSRYLLSDLTP